MGLSILLAGANAYLGLLAGMTVSASIPAAVVSMAVLRMFRKSNVLENNIVQTAASAGESLAAGVIFTFPALIILGVWTDFNYWQTTTIAALGGVIGVLFTIPLRRALVCESPLKFPEGVATAEVLIVGDKGGEGVKSLVVGGAIGALFKFGEGGLGLWTQAIQGAVQVKCNRENRRPERTAASLENEVDDDDRRRDPHPDPDHPLRWPHIAGSAPLAHATDQRRGRR